MGPEARSKPEGDPPPFLPVFSASDPQARAKNSKTARSLALFSGGHARWWSAPGTPQIGLGISASLNWVPFQFGLLLGASGWFCCDRSTDTFSSEFTEYHAYGTFSVDLLEGEAWALSPLVALGISVLDGFVTPKVFPGGPATPNDFTLVQGSSMLGLNLNLALGDLFFLRLISAARFSFNAYEIVLPAAFSQAGEPLRPGVVVPWLQISLGFKVF